MKGAKTALPADSQPMNRRSFHWLILVPHLPSAHRVSLEQNGEDYIRYLGDLQRLRARIYLADGAIQHSSVDSEGRHNSTHDADSWHILAVDAAEDVVGCIRVSPVDIRSWKKRPRLRQIDEALARMPQEKHLAYRLEINKFLCTLALESPMKNRYVLVTGGWAIAEDWRSSALGLQLALAPYALGRLIDYCGGLFVASERNNSHRILSKLGNIALHPRQEKSMFFDSNYGCRVGFLGARHDGVRPHFLNQIDHLERSLQGSRAIISP